MMKSKIALLLLTTPMLLMPVINIQSLGVMKSLDIYGATVFLVAIAAISKNKYSCGKIVARIFLALMMLLAQMLLLEVIYDLGDFTGVGSTLRSFISVAAAYGCAICFQRAYGEEAIKAFFKIIITCALIQGFVIWMSFLIPEFRDFMSIMFYREEVAGREHLVLLRVPGFAPSGGDGLSLNHALLCTIGLLGAYYNDARSLRRNILVLLLFISVISTVFTGRSGFYLGFALMAAVFVIYKEGCLRLKRVLYVFIVIGLILTALLISSELIGAYGEGLLEEYGYEHPIVRLLKGFIDLKTSGKYSDDTVQALLTGMVFFPEHITRFLVGNNDFGQMEFNYIESDVGYIRMWHGFGLIGLIIFVVGVFLLPLVKVSNIAGKVARLLQNNDKLIGSKYLIQIIAVVFLFGLVAHYKIFYLSTRLFLFLYFALLFLCALQFKEIFINHREKN